MLYRDRISRLAALALFLSAIELFIPRFMPFFRLGLSNIALLMALDLNASSFFALAILKGIGTSYIAGNLFSVFALISIAQSIASGAVMFSLKRILGNNISAYGISIAGALISTITQIFIASLYAGKGTLAFLPIMLALSFPSAVITAYLSNKIPEPAMNAASSQSKEEANMLPIILLIISCASILMTEEIVLLLPAVAAAFVFQHIAGRRIKLVPHLTLLVFMLLSSILTPNGEVLFKVFSFPITRGAIIDGLTKSLHLSGGIALSQGFSSMIHPRNGLIGKTISMFSMLLTAFQNAQGNLWSKFREALVTANTPTSQKTPVNVSSFTLICVSAFIFALAIADCVFF